MLAKYCNCLKNIFFFIIKDDEESDDDFTIKSNDNLLLVGKANENLSSVEVHSKTYLFCIIYKLYCKFALF